MWIGKKINQKDKSFANTVIILIITRVQADIEGAWKESNNTAPLYKYRNELIKDGQNGKHLKRWMFPNMDINNGDI